MRGVHGGRSPWVDAVLAVGGSARVAPPPFPEPPVTSSPRQRLEHGRLGSSRSTRRARCGRRRCTRGATPLHPDFGPPSTGSRSTWSAMRHADDPVRLHLRQRERPRAVSVRREHADRGWLGPARADDRPGHAARCTSSYGARWNGGNPKAGSGAIFDLASNALRPGGVDERRRRRAADLPGAGPLRRGAGRRDRPRDPLHRRRARATATSGRRGTRPASRDPRCPPMGARFRLKASFDLARFAPEARA